MRTSRKWLAFWAISVLTLMALAAATNYIVDPYGLYRSYERRGFNQQKEGMRTRIRHVKALELPLRKPHTILMGSSRVHDGLNPEHPALQQYPPVYNLAVDMCRINEALMYLRHALANSEIQRVVLGLDLFMFNAKEKWNFTYEPKLVGRKINAFDYLATSLLSRDAISDSVRTVKISSQQSGREEFLPDGYRPGSAVFFNVRDFESLHYATNWTFLSSIPKPTKYYADLELSPEVFDAFEQFLALCAEHHLDCRFFINPAHAGLDGEGLRAAGKTEMLEDWKRQITRMTDKHGVPLWDFSGYNSVTTETVRTPMKYYWDSSHYTELVGDWIIDRVMDGDVSTVPADFGTRLSGAGIEQHLSQIRADRARYAAEHPLDVARMNADYHRYLAGEPFDLVRTQNIYQP